MIAFGKKLKMARMGLDLSQQELADQANVSAPTIINAEKNDTEPSPKIRTRIESVLNRKGAFFTDYGVELRENWYSYSGPDWFPQLLDDVSDTLSKYQDKELLIAHSNDGMSPPRIIEKYRELRHQGVKMKQLIEEGNTEIHGDLDEYRYIPKQFFENYVHLIFGSKIALRDADDGCTVYTNPSVVKKFRNEFKMNWHSLPTPIISTSKVKFDT